jgi:hypothetical protein
VDPALERHLKTAIPASAVRLADGSVTPRLFAVDAPASSDLPREWMGWQPTHPGLIADLEQGHYFEP